MTAPQSPERGEGRLSAEECPDHYDDGDNFCPNCDQDHHEESPEIDALAVDICNHSGRHTAGDGDHNADRWGACSQCVHYARVVEAIVARREREAAERALRDAGYRAADDDTRDWPVFTRNPYRAALASGRAASGADSEDGQRDG